MRGFSCVSSVTMRPIACKASLCEGTTIVELCGVCFVGWAGCCNLELCCCCCWFVCFVLVSIYLFHTFFLFSIYKKNWGFLLSFFLSFCLFITKMSSACTYTIYIHTCIGMHIYYIYTYMYRHVRFIVRAYTQRGVYHCANVRYFKIDETHRQSTELNV